MRDKKIGAAQSQQEHLHRPAPAQETTSPKAEVDPVCQQVPGAAMAGDVGALLQRRHAQALSEPRMQHPTYARRKTGLVLQMQRSHGNRHVLRAMELGKVQRPRGDVPRRVGAASGHGHDAAREIAQRGTSGASVRLPFLDTIQSAFGHHDVQHVQAHFGPEAVEASRTMGAEAFTVGDHVAFAGAASLHTAAHEAAHVVQQRAGVQLKGGMGEKGDAYEQHADAVADRVLRGQSAEALLDGMAGGSCHVAVQRVEDSEAVLELREMLKAVDTKDGGLEQSEHERNIFEASAKFLEDMSQESVKQGSIRLVDEEGLIKGYASSHKTSEDYAREYIKLNRSRGFTAPDGLVWVLRDVPSTPHDLLHETVHVCSAPAGMTKIRREYGDALNEAFTEFFAERYCRLLKIPGAEAYPRQLAFGKALAEAVGVSEMYDAYMKDQGLDRIITRLVERWKRVGTQKYYVADPKNDQRNIKTIRNKFVNFDPDFDGAGMWWIKTNILAEQPK